MKKDERDMIAPLLASLGIALAPQTDGLDSAGSLGNFAEEINLSVRIEETELAAQSLSHHPLLLIFASEDQGLETMFWLPPGARYEEEFPRGTLNGIALEVLSTSDGGWVSTGSILLSDSLPLFTGGLWALDCGHVLAQSEGESLTAAASAGSTLPPSFILLNDQEPTDGGDPETGDTRHSPNLHVPVPTPTDQRKENKPPKLRPKPLPPV